MLSRIETSAKVEAAADSILLAREALGCGTVGTNTVYSALFLVEETLRKLSDEIGEAEELED